MPIVISADKTETKEEYTYYRGHVLIESGTLVISGETSFRKINDKDYISPINVKNANFSIIRGINMVRGQANSLVFNPKDCFLDIFGSSMLSMDGKTYDYKSARYVINKNELNPLWYYIDQSIKVR